MYLILRQACKREECRSPSTAAVGNDKAGYTPGLRKKSATDARRRQKSISHRAASLRKMHPQRSDARSFIKKLIAVDGRYIPRCIPRRWTLRRNAVDKTHTSVYIGFMMLWNRVWRAQLGQTEHLPLKERRCLRNFHASKVFILTWKGPPAKLLPKRHVYFYLLLEQADL